jgi:hypothetical protein
MRSSVRRISVARRMPQAGKISQLLEAQTRIYVHQELSEKSTVQLTSVMSSAMRLTHVGGVVIA